MRFTKNGAKVAAIVGVTVFIGLGATIMCIDKVPAGYVAGQYSISGGVKNDVLTAGWHLVSPTIHTSDYSIATEQLYMSKDSREGSKDDDSFDVTCKDGKLNADFEMAYSFDGDRIPQIMKRYRGLSGEEIINSVVRGKVKTYINEETSKYTVMDAHLEKRGELNKDIFNRLKKELSTYGIIVESANLSATRPDAKLADAIAKRAEKDQELQRVISETKIAEESAKKLKVEAEGKAEAARVEAQGQADANRKIQESLTNELIELKKVEKWNGQQPQVQGGGTPIINMK